MKMRRESTVAPCGADHQIAYPSFMASSVWGAILTFAVIVGSLALSCVAPLAALAVAFGATLGLRASLGVMTLVWLVNQAVGFTLFHFPWTANSLGRGVAMGLAALLVTIVGNAVLRPAPSRTGLARLCLAFLATFVAYETVLWLAALFLGGRDMFTVPIIMEVAAMNGAWLLSIIALNEIVAAVARPWLGRIPLIIRARGFS